MRESTASTWVMQLVIAFILLFVGFLALMVSFSKTFRAKNEVLTIIEKYEGISTTNDYTIEYVNRYLQGISYNTMGKCEVGWQGCKNFSNSTLEDVNASTNYYYCIKRMRNVAYNTVYYELRMFYVFNLPIVGKFTTFDVKGSTVDLKDW